MQKNLQFPGVSAYDGDYHSPLKDLRTTVQRLMRGGIKTGIGTSIVLSTALSYLGSVNALAKLSPQNKILEIPAVQQALQDLNLKPQDSQKVAPLATPVPGSELPVNTYTTGVQNSPAVAMDSDGDFVVVWQSNGQDGSYYGIYGQRYDSSGSTKGSEFKINTHTTNNQMNPTVAMDSDGDFVVAWQSYGQDGSYFGIYAQRYDSSGSTQGAEFKVNTYTTYNQMNPAVAMDSDGDFVVAWNSEDQDGSNYGIYAQAFTSSGITKGSEFKVNTYTTGQQRIPAVTMDSDGDFVVTWQSQNQDGSSYGIYAQRYDNIGSQMGPEFKVNTYTTGTQNTPAVAMDSDGDFVVAWQSYGQDGSFFGVYAQRYDSSGVTQGSEFPVNTYTTNNQKNPAVVMDSDGDILVAWESQNQDGSSYGVYGQRYDRSGTPQDSEFLVNTYTTNSQNAPTIAMKSDSDFVVAWQSYNQDGSNYGIYAKLYLGPLEWTVYLPLVER